MIDKYLFYSYFLFILPIILTAAYFVFRYITPLVFNMRPIPSFREYLPLLPFIFIALPLTGAILFFAHKLRGNIAPRYKKRYLIAALILYALLSLAELYIIFIS